VPVTCTPAQLAADDLFDWQAQLNAALPQGTGVVCIDSTPDDGNGGRAACDGVGTAYAVKEFWAKPTRGTVPVPQRFSTSVRP
jgi:type IV pilus assembly protein PilV